MSVAHCNSGQSRARAAQSGEASGGSASSKPQHPHSVPEPGGPLPRTLMALWRCCLAAAALEVRPSLDL